jgi:hypothetical protein
VTSHVMPPSPGSLAAIVGVICLACGGASRQGDEVLGADQFTTGSSCIVVSVGEQRLDS